MSLGQSQESPVRFQSPPREGRIGEFITLTARETFPVTSPRGEDHVEQDTALSRWDVSSHLPARGGSRLFLLDETAELRFPVTSPRGEDLDCPKPPPDGPRVSSHLPARGGSAKAWMRHNSKDVSSHLPARGGSGQQFIRRCHHGVSSHLPARGGSCWPVRSLLSAHGFQSPPREGRISRNHGHARLFPEFPVTSPRGEDRLSLNLLIAARLVSSHLPARGGSL